MSTANVTQTGQAATVSVTVSRGLPGATGAPGAPGAPGTTDYNELENVPTEFPPSAHDHVVSDITPVSSQHLIGRHANGNGDAQEVTVSGGLEFSGSGVQLADTDVTPAEYTAPTITVDAKGRITAAESVTYETPAGAAAQIAAAIAPLSFRTDGGTYEDFAWAGNPVVIADGTDEDGRQYHAFATANRCGDDLWLAYMTATRHASIDGDVTLKKSTDFGKTWATKKVFAASSPGGVGLGVGDYEWRQGFVTDLGGGALVCMLDKHVIVTGDDVVAPYTLGTAGRRSWYSLSNDGGETWQEPVQMPDFSGAVTTAISISGYGEIIWKGHYYAAFYSGTPASNAGVMRCGVESLRAGAPQWETVGSGDFGQEPFILVNPNDPDELWVSGRVNDTRISYRTSTDGTTWSAAKTSYYGLAAESSVGIRPDLVATGNGNWIFANRYTTGDITGEIVTGADPFPIYSGDGTPDDEQWPVKRNREFPNPFSRYNERAFGGVEKSMYYGFVPLGGDLIGVVAAYEPTEQYNTASSSTGHRSSIMFGYYGAGSGRTPNGNFTKAEVELKETEISLAESRNLFAWMTADTEYVITDGVGTVALELFGDWTPTFSDGTDPITPSGAYDPDMRNVAIISPGPAVQIVNQAPPSPANIPSLTDRVLVQLSPAGLAPASGTATGWTNEGDTDSIAAYTVSGTPTISVGSSPNGNNCVQGALTAWFNGPASLDLIAVYALASYPSATWDNGYEAIHTNAIQAQIAGTTARNVNTPWANHHLDFDGVKTTTGSPEGWHIWAARLRSTADGTGSRVTAQTDIASARLMSQPGQPSRGWTGKLAAYLAIGGDRAISDREDYLIRRWLRSL